nr:hypothetical protein [Tanacetum cinerariifolium]
MQEFWATAKLHHNSTRLKIDTRKSVLNLEAFREMLHISLRIPKQPFADLPTVEEILDFLRSFALVINKCLTGKSSGVDNFRLSQAQMLWGFYHRINIDFAYLIWEDFVYQVEHKNQKRSNEVNYPRFTKVIIDYFMTRKPSISRRNRINWHYIRDDALFSTIKVVSRHQTTQQYGAILPIELTTDEIRNSKAYKDYYACAMGEATPKPKASARKKKGDSASSTKAEQLKIVFKRSIQVTHISQQSGSGTNEGTGSKPGVLDVPSDDSEEELLWNSFDDEDVGEEELAKANDQEGPSARSDRRMMIESRESDQNFPLPPVLFLLHYFHLHFLKRKDTYGDSTILKQRREDDDQEGPSARSDRGSKRQKEEGEQASASTPSEKATESAGRSTKGSQSRQLSASKSAFAEEPVQTTDQMEEPPHPVFDTGANDQPIIQTSQHPEWFSQPRKPPLPDRAWNTTLPAAQGDAQSWISDLSRQTDAHSSFNELLDTPIDFSKFIMHQLNVDTLTPDLLAGPT